MSEPCVQEKELGKIVAIMDGLVKEFYGNGKKGIAREFPELRSSVENLTYTVASQTTAISALAKTITEIKAVDEYKDKESNFTWQKAAVYCSSIIGIAGVIAMIIFKA